ncbi:MAG: amidase family protein, partial [Planctomycetota bacterium]|nr:amidase family protein [Planctomycetota bacterium]
AAGAVAHGVDLSLLDYAVPTYYIVATAEASTNLARYDGVHYGHRTPHADNIVELMSKSRAEGFGAEVKRRIMLGTYVLSAGYYDAYYLRALKVRQRLAQDFARAWAQVDVLAMPVSPTTAFRLGEKLDDPLAMYLADIYTIAANLAGLPAISVPAGFDRSGLPIGMQFLAPRFRDDLVLRAAAACEKAVGIGPRIAAGEQR